MDKFLENEMKGVVEKVDETGYLEIVTECGCRVIAKKLGTQFCCEKHLKEAMGNGTSTL